jgi:tetratricopeptide (TPR) repeat protein
MAGAEILNIRTHELVKNGNRMFEQEQFTDALEAYLGALAVFQELNLRIDDELMFRVGMCISETEGYEEAVYYYREIIAAYQGEPLMVSRAYFERGSLHMENSAYLDALTDYDLAREHLRGDFSPRHHEINGTLSRTLEYIRTHKLAAKMHLFSDGPGELLESDEIL